MDSSQSFKGSQGKLTRRQFLYTSALAAGATALSVPAFGAARKLSANDKLNIGVVGAGGKGSSDTNHCAKENIVALCDVDESQAGEQRKRYPNAKFYKDWRQMFEKEKSLDAVIVATPDHMHAIVAAAAMREAITGARV